MQVLTITLITICLALAGCSAGAGSSSALQTLTAKQLFSGQQCGGQDEEGAVRWITVESAYQDLAANIHGTVLGKPRILPKVDFYSHGVLVVSMGQKTTAGYSLALVNPEVRVKNQTATVNISRWEPKPGTMAAQMVTSPCVLISLPKADFSQVRIVDQDARVLAEALLLSSN